jgi:hypothetical protein
MPSYSRNKPVPALLLGVSAALLGTVGHAADDTRFTLTAYSNVVGGREILHGDYQTGLARINAQASSEPDAELVSLNRCVALTMTAQWPAAQVACNAAVHEAERARTSEPVTASVQDRHLHDETIAIAYSNRAVLEWLTKDLKGAAQDLERAKALSPGGAMVAQNVAALGTHSNMAVVRSAEER